MKGTFRCWLALGFILSFSGAGFGKTPSAGDGQPALNITVRVYNYAPVSGARLARAEKVAENILNRAGIETHWVHCSFSEGDSSSDAACKQDLSPTHLVLRLAPRPLAKRSAFEGAELGLALQPTHAGRKSFAGTFYIFYNRVESLASGRYVSQAQILGHGIAHEIGHLLIGSASHSPRGIMQAEWDREVLQAAAKGKLTFTSKQAKRIRSALLERTKVQEALELAALASSR